MLCVRHLAQRLLTFTALACLGATALSSGATLLANDTTPDDGSKHRGSGRVTSQTIPAGTAVANRGSGRYFPEDQVADNRGSGRYFSGDQITLAHRGSGRIENEPTEAPNVAYRGSGRITPSESEMSRLG